MTYIIIVIIIIVCLCTVCPFMMVSQLALMLLSLMWLSKFFLTSYYHSVGSDYYWYDHTFHVPQSFCHCTQTLVLPSFCASFSVTFMSAGIATSINMPVFSLFLKLLYLAYLP